MSTKKTEKKAQNQNVTNVTKTSKKKGGEKKEEKSPRNLPAVVCGVLYPESCDIKQLEDWAVDHHYLFSYILHDRDLDEKGNPKKPHWHVLLTLMKGFSHPRANSLDKIAPPHLFDRIRRSADGYRRYFCHLDDPDKVQYGKDEVHTNDPQFFECYRDPDKHNRLFDDLQKVRDGDMTWREFYKTYPEESRRCRNTKELLLDITQPSTWEDEKHCFEQSSHDFTERALAAQKALLRSLLDLQNLAVNIKYGCDLSEVQSIVSEITNTVTALVVPNYSTMYYGEDDQ